MKTSIHSSKEHLRLGLAVFASVLTLSGVGGLAQTPTAGPSAASPGDALINKLVEKGILTLKEANDLRQESKQGFNKALASRSGRPDLVSSLKFNGDFRGRFDRNYADNGAFTTRDRYRYRLRLGVTASFHDDFTVGFRLASANAAPGVGIAQGGNPVSLNTDLGLGSSKKFVFIDTAFASWNPIPSGDWTLSFTAGKFDNPFVISPTI